MPNENEIEIEKTEKAELQNPSPGEIADKANAEKATVSKKNSSNSRFAIFKHLFPALKEAFASGTKTFKKRVQGIPESEQSAAEEEKQQKNAVPNVNETKDKSAEEEPQKTALPNVNETEDKGVENSLPQQQAGFFESNLAAGSKKRKFLLAFLISLIIIIPMFGGLYLGGMFDEEEGAVPHPQNGKPVSAAPQEDSRKESVFDSIFGKKNQKPATPKEQLEAMHITYSPNNFVKYAGQNDMDVVKLFIRSGMHPDTRRTVDGFTPLTAAAVFDRQKIAEFLLDGYGADINAKDNDGQTPLIKAVRYNRPFMVAMLLERKADYNIADNQGHTALSMAKEQYGDNPLTRAFEKFGIDLSGAKKEPVAEKKPIPEKNPVSTPPLPDKTPAQTKKSPYLEMSVQEFLKLTESEQTPAPSSQPAPKPAPTPKQ